MTLSADLNIKNEARERVRCGSFIQRQHIDEGLNTLIFLWQMGADQFIYIVTYFCEGSVESLVSIGVFADSFGCMGKTLRVVDTFFSFIVENIRMEISRSIIPL